MKRTPGPGALTRARVLLVQQASPLSVRPLRWASRRFVGPFPCSIQIPNDSLFLNFLGITLRIARRRLRFRVQIKIAGLITSHITGPDAVFVAAPNFGVLC